MSDHRQPCPATTVSGDICGTPTTRYFEGLGWRCRHHAEGQWPKAPDDEKPTQNPPPVDQLKSLRDAEQLYAWATIEAANGRMDKDQGALLHSLITGWRVTFGDRKLKKEQDELRRDIKKIKRDKSERFNKRREAAEDTDE